MYGELIRLDGANPKVLHSYEGHDYRGAGATCEDGYALIYHDLTFVDLDDDGMLEMRDRLTQAVYAT